MSPADLQFGVSHRLDRNLFAEEVQKSNSTGWPAHYQAIVEAQEEFFDEAKVSIARTQASTSERAVSRVDPNPFKVDQWILVEKDASVKTGERKRDGPFQVSSTTDATVTYKSPTYPGRTFTVPLARVSKFTLRPGQNPLGVTLRDHSRYFAVESVRDHRPKLPEGKQNKINNTEILIKWIGFDEDQNTWEPLSKKDIRGLDQFAQYAQDHPSLVKLVPK